MTQKQPTLYIVATPIGTLSDLSPRAREILSKSGFIACEDTRHTKELLMALGLQHGPLVSLHEHNERNKSESLILRLKESPEQNAALVSDAGTPAISDPGAVFVDACHAAGIKVESIPGPSSLVAAAAASGFLRPRILFSGFLPRSENDQLREFKLWTYSAPCVAVCFESPNRVLQSLKHAADFFPADSIRVCVSREISKKFEQHIRGTIADVLREISDTSALKGECVLCFDLPETLHAGPEATSLSQDEVVRLAINILDKDPNARVRDVTKKLAEEHGFSAKELYNSVIGLRNA